MMGNNAGLKPIRELQGALVYVADNSENCGRRHDLEAIRDAAKQLGVKLVVINDNIVTPSPFPLPNEPVKPLCFPVRPEQVTTPMMKSIYAGAEPLSKYIIGPGAASYPSGTRCLGTSSHILPPHDIEIRPTQSDNTAKTQMAQYLADYRFIPSSEQVHFVDKNGNIFTDVPGTHTKVTSRMGGSYSQDVNAIVNAFKAPAANARAR